MLEHKEKRKGLNPVPDDPLKYMNEAQIRKYLLMQGFGMRIKFIRRSSLSQNPVCVMTDPEMTALAVLENDGFLNRQPNIPLRIAETSPKEIIPTDGICIVNDL